LNTIQYGQVVLSQVKVQRYTQEAVYNSLDYLYTRHRLTVRATFNPATQHDGYAGEVVNWAGGARQADLAVPGDRPPPLGALQTRFITPAGTPPRPDRPGAYTVTAVRHQLLQPRYQLRWVMDGVPVLTSPLPGILTDSTNGPMPVSCDVVEERGSKTFLVDWTVQTDINECPRFVEHPVVVLSHSWDMEDDVDQDYYTVRRVSGKTVLDAQVVRGRRRVDEEEPAYADYLRQYFFHPIPEGWKRQGIKVKLLGDGVTVLWSYEDREMPFTYVASANADGTSKWPGVTRIEALHVAEAGSLSGTALLKGAGSVGKGAGGGLDTLIKLVESAGGFMKMGLGFGWGAIRGGMDVEGKWYPSPSHIDWLSPIRQAFSTSNHTFIVRVWGNKDSDRTILEEVAREVIYQRRARLDELISGLIPTGTKITHDVAGSFVEGIDTYVGPPMFSDRGEFNRPRPLPAKFPGNKSVFSGENTPGVLEWENLDGKIWPMPSEDHGRGTSIEALVGQWLTYPCNPTKNVPPVERELRASPPPVGTPPPNPDMSPPPPSPAPPPILTDPVYVPKS
jgi:hypothetical protein